MRIAVVGAGAVGAHLGAALARSGQEVALLARGPHLEAMRRDGVRIVAPDQEYTVHPLATGDPGEVGPVDLVVLAVKAHAQAAAGAAVQALLGPDTPVVAAQNGIPWWYFHAHGGTHDGRRIEAVDPAGAVSSAIAPHRAIGLVAYVGAQIAAPGVVQVRPEAGLVMGEPDGGDSPRLRAAAGALREAGFEVRTRPDIRVEVWTKLLGNATFNPISALTRSGLGTIARHPGTRAVVAAAMQEMLDVADRLGARPTMSIPDRLAITERLGEHKTSTLQDLEAGRRLELDAILTAVVELAGLVGVEAPTVRTLHALADLQARVLGVR